MNIAAPFEAGITPQHDTVVVAAEDRSVRTRMVNALGQPELSVRGTSSAREFAGEAPAPDMLVLHCEEVGTAEVALLRELKREYHGVRIVIVCESASGRSTRRALDGGADGYVLADRLEVALPPTIAAVFAGQTAVPSQLGASVRKASLSFREKQILGMVVMGFTNSQIGARLFLAESTVKSHLSSAFTKLGVRSRSEAAALILDPQESLGIGILGITDRLSQPGPSRVD